MAYEALWGFQQPHWDQAFRSDAVQDPILRKLFWTRVPITIHTVQIERRGAKVRRLSRGVPFEQRGSWVERDIVVQKLTKEGDASRHVGIVGIVWTEHRGIRDGLNGIGQVIQGIDDASFFAQLLAWVPASSVGGA